MDGSQPRKRSTAKPGLRALEACGDGFWELDLKSGSAWYSPWFYQKLDWPTETRRTTLGELESVLKAQAWMELMARIRAHLEQGRPLELDFEVAVPLDSVSLSVNSGVPVLVALLYRLNVTVPVGLSPPETVA